MIFVYGLILTEIKAEVFIMPLLNKAIVGHLIVIAFLSILAIYIMLKLRNRLTIILSLIIFIPVIFYFCYCLYTMYHTTFEISSESLTIRSGLQTRSICVEEIRNVFIPDSEFKPKLRTFGLALPGYKSGWFTLKNNEKGLLFLTNFEESVCVRTNKYVIVFSVETPERFMDTSNTFWNREEKETEINRTK